MEILHALTEMASVAHGGCIFCSSKGSGELIKSAPDISSQVTQYFESYRAKRANKFIAYFQNFTNTYDTIQNLKEKYDSALIDDRIVGLDIATRPDCIDENVAKLISTYIPKYKVFVELGLQTSNDSTGSLINRGYNSSKFTEAVSILNKYNIEKRPLSKLLGMGELTITRYMDGQLPSKKYSDYLYEILNDEQKMKSIVKKNHTIVSNKTIYKVNDAIKKCEEEKKCETIAEKIALYIIDSNRGITNLFLQKILYYIKAIGKLLVEYPIITDECEAWRFGPVFPNIYEKYKNFGKQEIILDLPVDYAKNLLTKEEKQVTDFVLNTFGIYNIWFLKDLTHMEEPWLSARNGIDEEAASNNPIDDNLIDDYFEKINKKYNLKNAEGIDQYIHDMREKMSRSANC